MKNKLEEKALEYARKLQAHIDAKIVYENAGILNLYKINNNGKIYTKKVFSSNKD